MADEEEVITNENEQDNPNDSPEQKANKVTKKYLNVLAVIQAVVGGEGNLKPLKKVEGDVTASIVAELFKEEEKALKEKVKTGLQNLLKQHVQLEADVAAKKADLEKLQLEKRKEFTKAANAWLQQVDQGVVRQESYKEALKTAFSRVDENEKK